MWLERIANRVIGEKKRWRTYKARVRALPEPYRASADALERYVVMTGGILDADHAASLLENLADLFEQAASEGTPIREIVGDDPLEFIEAFLANYSAGDWRAKERQRLIDAIDTAAGDRPPGHAARG